MGRTLVVVPLALRLWARQRTTAREESYRKKNVLAAASAEHALAQSERLTPSSHRERGPYERPHNPYLYDYVYHIPYLARPSRVACASLRLTESDTHSHREKRYIQYMVQC